jgi:ketosteroid isomerase-like protein
MVRLALLTFYCFASFAFPPLAWAVPDTPEQVLRDLVRANAEKDLPRMAALMAQDSDAVGYSIGGRKYIGWTDFAREMQREFESVARLEIPITELKVWQAGDIAWFTMELDYIRYVGHGKDETRTSLPLRETGVLAHRQGKWILVSWHESFRNAGFDMAAVQLAQENRIMTAAAAAAAAAIADPSGRWEIHEEDKTYIATLDRQGNGTYTHQGGRILTTRLADGQWHGTWHQSGNDREGGFELRLSEDGMEAKGIWWYSRVGQRNNIPPRQHGGTYLWKRLSPAAASSKKP